MIFCDHGIQAFTEKTKLENHKFTVSLVWLFQSLKSLGCLSSISREYFPMRVKQSYHFSWYYQQNSRWYCRQGSRWYCRQGCRWIRSRSEMMTHDHLWNRGTEISSSDLKFRSQKVIGPDGLADPTLPVRVQLGAGLGIRGIRAGRQIAQDHLCLSQDECLPKKKVRGTTRDWAEGIWNGIL
jgi:hypothetical protein